VKRKRNSAEEDSNNNASKLLAVLSRIANLLALLAVKDQRQEHQVLTLSAAGYAPAEIAKLINTTPNTVRVTLSTSRARAKKKPKKP
jgi:hypothetical protein